MQKRLLLLEYQAFLLSGELYPSDILIDHDCVGVFGNETCLTVPCRYWNDGATELLVWPADEMPASEAEPNFDGWLNTPHRSVVCSDVNELAFLVAEVPDTRTRARIWLDNPAEPAKIVIALG